ncbi:MAG TPA: methyl-accepting chemotaxis protein [Chthonomonadaceae bacterium]|nr:methyl-accepting chemotaxis protein [Chthonomonadaceae bacterium]
MADVDGRTGPAGARTRNRRRASSHFVNHDVRLRLVLDDAAFALIAALLAIGILYYLSNREIGDSMYSAHVSIRQTRELLNNGVKVAGIVTFVAVLAFGLWSLIDAHRIAGPLHRLSRLLNEIADGNLVHEIAFRKGDEFAELAAAADRLVESYSRRLQEARSLAQELERGLTTGPLTEQQAAALRGTAEQLSRSLSFFQLAAPDARPVVDDTPLA